MCDWSAFMGMGFIRLVNDGGANILVDILCNSGNNSLHWLVQVNKDKKRVGNLNSRPFLVAELELLEVKH